MKRIASCVISVTERVSLNSEKMEIDLLKIIFENSGGESDLSSADEDDIIDAVYGHGELTITVCMLCVCVFGFEKLRGKREKDLGVTCPLLPKQWL